MKEKKRRTAKKRRRATRKAATETVFTPERAVIEATVLLHRIKKYCEPKQTLTALDVCSVGECAGRAIAVLHERNAK